MNPIFHLLSKHSTNEPLIDDFLFGDYADRPYPATTYNECIDGSTVAFSKNTSRFPKIIGRFNLAVQTDLMLDLRARVTAKWRKIEFTDQFEFAWDSDGFEIIEKYRETCRTALEAAGITDSYEQDDQILTDDGLVYLDIVKKYRTERSSGSYNFWELVAVNSYRTLEASNVDSFLVVSKTDQNVCRFNCDFNKESVEDGGWPLSTQGLAEHGILSLYSGAFAATNEIMRYIAPWVEPEYYTIRPVFEHDIGVADR
jgi:hypothetical protein